ncbi:YqhA family protein [Flavihumibacter fluvii]|uniref:YqhA family protein n=1 Tax=Flavihumibacter fluvii TaxID=2838157 RepID=UPI001BDEFE3B|nr:YqhA family protein [Flavihumibacter fluvii]ULQ52671.1 YqhA family protein [Flavihumibacter fluvii]
MSKIIRFCISIIVSLVLLNGLLFMIMGIYRSIHAYMILAHGRVEDKPGVMIAESLDSFLIALFFVIFALGIAKLFLPKTNFMNGYELPWLNIENFSQLKYIMWEMLLTTIFVYYVSKIVIAENQLEWTMLIFPGSILMLAVAFKLLKQSH